MLLLEFKGGWYIIEILVMDIMRWCPCVRQFLLMSVGLLVTQMYNNGLYWISIEYTINKWQALIINDKKGRILL